jgi:hypothetical protein
MRRDLGPDVARGEWPPGAGLADGVWVAGAAVGGRAPASAHPVAGMIAAAATAVAMTRWLITTTGYGAGPGPVLNWLEPVYERWLAQCDVARH